MLNALRVARSSTELNLELCSPRACCCSIAASGDFGSFQTSRAMYLSSCPSWQASPSTRLDFAQPTTRVTTFQTYFLVCTSGVCIVGVWCHVQQAAQKVDAKSRSVMWQPITPTCWTSSRCDASVCPWGLCPALRPAVPPLQALFLRVVGHGVSLLRV